jgi:2-phospho-L-lactate guanylyltransferase
MTHTIVTQPWVIVIPVKRPEIAKTRLADAVDELRPHLARAFAADTTTAALACPDVSRVVVVTDDDDVARQAVLTGAHVVEDAPDAGLNPALVHGVAHARALAPQSPVATLSADLPALRSGELSSVLQAAAQHPASFLADAAGTGTTLYATAPGVRFAPRFGLGSRLAHLAAGAVELEVVDVDSVRRDVDTADDLWDAVRLGLGAHSQALIAQLDAVVD